MNNLTTADKIAAAAGIFILLAITLFSYMDWKWKHDTRHACSSNPADTTRGTNAECEQYLKNSGALE